MSFLLWRWTVITRLIWVQFKVISAGRLGDVKSMRILLKIYAGDYNIGAISERYYIEWVR